ncbi:MAG: ATP-grasp domain-containing protein [Deltaproteobacteria bacterium]|nr:ATP-grasp domain-containing protein [Deltaproteobacteria bacterium]
MKIAFTHNLQLNSTEEEAEFDTPKTVEAITRALVALGHTVEPVEVSGPASRTVARLEALRPDLVFNTAEGHRGRFREAFYPGLFEELGFPYTGSDAYVCAVTLDKQLTKVLLEEHGVPSPRGVLIERAGQPVPQLRYPVIVKPNYEGSSKGISQDSVVESRAELQAKLKDWLKRYPTGVLVEEYIEGRDVVVPFLAKASPETGGVLAAGEYTFDPKVTAGRKYLIYEYDLKQTLSDAVSVQVPAELDLDLAERLAELSRTIYRALGIRDLGRIDFRVTPEGEPYFIEINALPSLEPGAGIYQSAALAGLETMESVLGAVIGSAAERWGIKQMKRTRRKKALVGLTYNLKRIKPEVGGLNDEEAEYDAPTTIAAVREAIESYGHEVVELEATPELAAILPASGVDVVFNIAEGIRGRSRESQVPALLELIDVPYTGSDPATLSLALDKGLAKRVVHQAGVHTPRFVVLHTGKERLPKWVTYPVMVKPVAEGSSKGVAERSVATSEAELRAAATAMIGRYRQPALVEEFLTGREFTVGLLGDRRPKVLPPMEIVFLSKDDPHPIYTFDDKLDIKDKIRYEVPAKVDPPLLKELEKAARNAFVALGCRDVARIDLRLDSEGRVSFIECNPLPGLTPGWSDLCLIAEGAGMSYRSLVGEILAPAMRRFRNLERERSAGQEPSPGQETSA